MCFREVSKEGREWGQQSRRFARTMSSQTKEIVTERTDAARSVHRPGEESSKLKPGSCEELGKASVKVRPKGSGRRASCAAGAAAAMPPILRWASSRSLSPLHEGCDVLVHQLAAADAPYPGSCLLDGVSFAVRRPNPAPQSCGRSDRKPRARPQCIEDHGYNRSAPECQVHFDAYKECRKKETASRKGFKSLFADG